MPYGCARAICVTFCWKMRWALTPIFGPSFLRDCIPPSSSSFQCFRIAPEVIRVCEREAEGWRGVDPRSYTPISDGAGHIAPMSASTTSAPRPMTMYSPKKLRPRKNKAPLLESPFSTEFEDEDIPYSRSKRRTRTMYSPSVSPKTQIRALPVSPSSAGPRGWATVNNSQRSLFATPDPGPAGQVTPAPFPDVSNFYFSPSAAVTPLVANQRMLYPTAVKRAQQPTHGEDTDGDMEAEGQGGRNAKKAKISYKCKARDYNAAKALMMLHDADKMLLVPQQQRLPGLQQQDSEYDDEEEVMAHAEQRRGVLI